MQCKCLFHYKPRRSEGEFELEKARAFTRGRVKGPTLEKINARAPWINIPSRFRVSMSPYRSKNTLTPQESPLTHHTQIPHQ